jgi:hypothetical protein
LAAWQLPSQAIDMANQAKTQAASFRFTVLSVIVLILGATGLFVQTKRAFRIIWFAETDEGSMVLGTFRSYVCSFLLIPIGLFCY